MTDLQTIDQLTAIECRSLQDYETTIEQGLQTFYAVGAALMAIREQRLYRASHSTFEDYCRDRWSMSKTSANRLITAADVVNDLTPIGVIPANEAQARPLASLPAEQRREVWSDVIEQSNGKPTAKDVQEAVKQRVAAWQPGQPDPDWEGEARAMLAEAEAQVSLIQRIVTISRAYRPITFIPDKGVELRLREIAHARLWEARDSLRKALQERGIELVSTRHKGGDQFYTLSGAVEGEWVLTDMEALIAEPEPAEPAPMPDDLRSELSRLGWELRSSRISPAGLHLYTLCSEGGRGSGEERGIDGWQVMLEQLKDEEQRRIAQRLRQPDTPAQRMQKIDDAFPRGAIVIWSKADGTEHLMDVVGSSFGGERVEIRPHGTLDMSQATYVPPAKLRPATDADQDRFEAAKQYRETLLKATRTFLHDMTTKQRDLLCHLLGCYRPDVAEKLVDKLAENRGFLRIIGIEGSNE